MKSKSQIFAFFIFTALLLGSCSPAPSANHPTVTSATPKTPNTPTPKPTLEPPTPIGTATSLPPTEVPIYRITQSELANFDWNTSWTDISWDKYQKGLNNLPPADIAAKVNDSTEPVQLLNRITSNGNMIIGLQTLQGTNLFITRALRIENPSPWSQLHVLETWVVFPGPDGHNHVYRLNILFNGDPDTDLWHIHNLGKGGERQITFQLSQPEAKKDPDIWSIIEGETPARLNMYDGKIDENTKNEFMLLLRE